MALTAVRLSVDLDLKGECSDPCDEAKRRDHLLGKIIISSLQSLKPLHL